MVVIFFPETLEIGVTQERVAAPLTCTVHAPHSAMPHPNFVPVIPSVSRSTHSSGMLGLTFTVCDFPFNVNWVAMQSLSPKNTELTSNRQFRQWPVNLSYFRAKSYGCNRLMSI